ncbi:putative FCP1 y domain-containing protein [Rhodotorula toruloides]|nr:putative FCP1 y domain-containing protein [Rhodotorula toruloides]
MTDRSYGSTHRSRMADYSDEDDAPVDSRTPSDDFTTDEDDDSLPPLPSRSRSAATPRTANTIPAGGLPRQSYWRDLGRANVEQKGRVRPKSKLLVSDLDNTLLAPNGDGVIARPYLKTFIKYITHPSSPYKLALWTFSGRQWGTAHLRQVGMGKYLFDSTSEPVGEVPKLKEGVVAFWGYEDSGFTAFGQMEAGKPLKDLDLMWDMLNITTHSHWSQLNSLIADDQRSNARAQPDSIVNCPVFTNKCPDDEFLLAFIGVLDSLAHESNFSSFIQSTSLNGGIDPARLPHYCFLGETVCGELGIKVERGFPYPRPEPIERMRSVAKLSPTRHGPVHDAAPEPTTVQPLALPLTSPPTPLRLAAGMPTGPSYAYAAEVGVPSRVLGKEEVKKQRPLVVFDLDGTHVARRGKVLITVCAGVQLYCRPPQNLEHMPDGEPAGRPYLRTFLSWLMRYESPWSVAIWTGSQKATAISCLYALDLGLVGPSLTSSGEAEILHPKLLAVWAREDFGLTKKDYESYVAVVKDLERLWEFLAHKNGAWQFDASNTVMVDDTPSKLRAQPYSLIAAPSYLYPFGPGSIQTTRSLMDQFLLALVGMLDSLLAESNFAAFIKSMRWYDKDEGTNEVQTAKEMRRWMNEGLEVLRKAEVPVEVEGRGLVPGVKGTENEPRGIRTAPVVVKKAPAVFRSSAAITPSTKPAAPPTPSAPAAAVGPSGLTAANLSALNHSKGDDVGVNSDTDNASDTTSSSVNGDAADDDRASKASTEPAPPSSPLIRPVSAPPQRKSAPRSRFEREMDALRALHPGRRKGRNAVEDWELLSEDPDEKPREVKTSRAILTQSDSMGASARASTAVERRGLPELVLPGTEADGGRTSVSTERMAEKRVASSPRPITFALPPLPSPRLSSTSPQLTPNSEHANPFATSPSSPSSGFLGRLGRKLSLGRRGSRKGAASSERRKSRDVGDQVPPSALAVTEEKENVPPSTSPRTARTGVRVQLVDPGPSAAAAPPSPELSRRRSLRVSSALLRRSKSEGSSPSAAPVRRRRSARRGQDRLWTEEEKYAELASRRRAERGGEGEGGYVWDEGLGLCWDGREMVRPDLLSSTTTTPHEPYTSNSDFLPSSLPQAAHTHALSSSTTSHRIVYASTLSSFPPRPPLKGKERELTPAEKVVREYREKWGWLTPSVRSFRLDDEAEEREKEEGVNVEEGDEGDLPTPTPSNPLSTDGFPPLSPAPHPQTAIDARTLSRLDPSLPPHLSHTDSPSASPVSPTHASKASTASSSVPSERYGFTSRTRSSRGRKGRGEGGRGSRDSSAEGGEEGGSETSHGTAEDDGEEDEDEDAEEEGRKRGGAEGRLGVPFQQRKMDGSFVTADEGAEEDAVDDWQECE